MSHSIKSESQATNCMTYYSFGTEQEDNINYELKEKRIENETKKKLRSSCKQNDDEKTGLLDKKVLGQLLQENGILLRVSRRFVDSNGKVNYYEFTRNIRRESGVWVFISSRNKSSVGKVSQQSCSLKSQISQSIPALSVFKSENPYATVGGNEPIKSERGEVGALGKTPVKSEIKGPLSQSSIEDFKPNYDFFKSLAPECDNRSILIEIATNVMQNQIDVRKFITLKTQCAHIQIQDQNLIMIDKFKSLLWMIFPSCEKLLQLIIDFCQQEISTTGQTFINFNKVEQINKVIQLVTIHIKKNRLSSENMSVVISPDQKPNKGLDQNLRQCINKVQQCIHSKFSNLVQAFRHFDRFNRLQISFKDLTFGLDKLQNHQSQFEMQSLFAYFDKQRQGFWNFEDFSALYQEGVPFNHQKVEAQEQDTQSQASFSSKKTNFQQLNQSQYVSKSKVGPMWQQRNVMKGSNSSTITYGIQSLPSDNMESIINHDYRRDYIQTMIQRQNKHNEMERITRLQQHQGIYLTKTAMMRIENMKKRQQLKLDDFDPYAVPVAAQAIRTAYSGAGLKEHRKSQDHIKTRKSHSIFTSNNDFISLNKDSKDELDDFKQVINSSSVFDLPPQDKKINNLMNFATAPSENGRNNYDEVSHATEVSLPNLRNITDNEDIKSRRMSQQKKMSEYFTNKRKLMKNRY